MTIRALQSEAKYYGLFIKSYNPGRNMTYKVSTEDKDYFALNLSTFRTHLLKEVAAFIEGYKLAKGGS